jgi:hypothetical protein
MKATLPTFTKRAFALTGAATRIMNLEMIAAISPSPASNLLL